MQVKKKCSHNDRSRSVDGFHCYDCGTFFHKDSPTYRRDELLNTLWMVLNNINADSLRSGNGPLKEVLEMKEEIGIGVKHDNYENLISKAEAIMSKYGKDNTSCDIILKEKESR